MWSGLSQVPVNDSRNIILQKYNSATESVGTPLGQKGRFISMAHDFHLSRTLPHGHLCNRLKISRHHGQVDIPILQTSSIFYPNNQSCPSKFSCFLACQLTSSLGIKTLGGDGINFIDEDNGRCILFGQSENIPDHAWPFTQVLLHEFRPHDPNESSWVGGKTS